MGTEKKPVKEVWVVIGTRPEVIKQIPAYLALRNRPDCFSVKLVSTGQHRELLDQALAAFSVKPDLDLNIMEQNQTLTGSSASILNKMEKVFTTSGKPDVVLVQGDTSTAAMVAVAAFQNGIPVAHNEAGLRSYNLEHPFPEEANRRWISTIARYHLAPTERAAEALRKEGVSKEQIYVTGNTGIDAFLKMLERPAPSYVKTLLDELRLANKTPVLMTAHRRENQTGFDMWFSELTSFLSIHPELELIFPLHPNNRAREAANEFLKKLPNARLIDPLDYLSTCHLLAACRFVITDSGGIQEEASSLGIPVIVCRQTTERMEAVEAEWAMLSDPQQPEHLGKALQWAVSKQSEYRLTGIFGDGKASEKITEILAKTD